MKPSQGGVSLHLTHWGRVTQICISKLTIISSDNGLSPGGHQAIIWTNAGILLIGPLGTNFSGIFIKIHTFSFKKMRFKMSSGKWRPFCLGLNVLTWVSKYIHMKMYAITHPCPNSMTVQPNIVESRAWLSNYIPQKTLNVITCPCPGFR